MTRIPVMKDVKIIAVMSIPRLTFSDSTHIAYGALLPLGIGIQKGSGVFWGQQLTRLMEQHLDDCDYLLTVDYDTIFFKEHIIRMAQLALEFPEADAIFPLQIRRHYDYPMMQRDKEKDVRIPATEFQQPLVPMIAGHFGLTLLKTAALKKFEKPWFMPQPDKDGGWNDGRKDEDIYFWHHFTDSGFKLFVAPEVKVGHLVEMCVWPGPLKNGLKPEYTHLNDIEKGIIPEGCIPKIS